MNPKMLCFAGFLPVIMLDQATHETQGCADFISISDP